MAPGTSRRMTGDRGLVFSWHLPRDTLIEFVIRCWLGLASNRSFPASGIFQSGGRRDGNRGAGDVASPRCASIWRAARAPQR
jgi:hypothetical protein